jgi:hypothetical protein
LYAHLVCSDVVETILIQNAPAVCDPYQHRPKLLQLRFQFPVTDNPGAVLLICLPWLLSKLAK